VALSDWDRSRLREIEEHTRATDPDFVTRLDLAVVLRHRRQLRRMCWWLQALGAWITLMGLSAARGAPVPWFFVPGRTRCSVGPAMIPILVRSCRPQFDGLSGGHCR